MKERTILTLVILTLVILAAGYFAATNLDVMPDAASSRARLVDQLARVLIGLGAVILLVVNGALVYAVIRFRKRVDDESDAVPNHGNNTLELVWTIIPAFIVVFIGFYSFQVLTEIEQPVSDEMVVEVIGRQFLWEFRYPGFDLTTQELRLPVGKPIRFEITSADVIHSFWVPEFRAKRDATPGLISELLITPTELGTYPIRCAELCGAGHAAMNAQVIVETEGDFMAWIELQGGLASGSTAEGEQQGEPPLEEADPGEVSESPDVNGSDLFTGLGCGACHTLNDASAVGVLGPSLNNFSEIAATRIFSLEPIAYAKESIVDPDAYVVDGYPGGVMPADFGERISVEELEALITYLLNQ